MAKQLSLLSPDGSAAPSPSYGSVTPGMTSASRAMILKNNYGKPKRKSPIDKFIDWFNKKFENVTGKYIALLGRIVDRRIITYGIFVLFAVGTFLLNTTLPAGFIPSEDQGMIYAIIQMPPGSTLERTNDLSRKLQKIAEEVDGIAVD